MNNEKFKKIFKYIVLSAVLLIPFMYSFFYLKSYWNPYGNLQDLRVAIVNEDKTKDNSLSEKFIDSLKESDTCKFEVVSEDTANNGLTKGNYYAVITLPKDFTKNINNSGEKNRHVTTITYTPNQKTNYISSQIISRIVLEAQKGLEEQIAEGVVDGLTDNLKEVPKSLEKIVDATDKIEEGSSSLTNGLKDINEGTSKLNSSYKQFDEGVTTAYQGSKTLSSSIDTLDSSMNLISQGSKQLSNSGTSGINELVNGIKQLEQGSKQVSMGVSNISTSLNANLNATENSLKSSIGVSSVSEIDSKISALEVAMAQYGTTQTNPQTGNNFITDYKSLLQAKGAIQALEGAKSSISASANDSSSQTSLYALSNGAKQVSDGASKLASTETTKALNNLVSGMGSLEENLQKVNAGTKELKKGSEKLDSGLKTLNESSKIVSTSLNTLNDGTNKAYQGSITLNNGINTFKNEVTTAKLETEEKLTKLDGLSEYVGSSVEIKEEPVNKINEYGVAFTPLFLSIGLWVGALMCYVVLYYDQKHRFNIFDKEKAGIKQNICYIGFAAALGFVTALLLKVLLGFSVSSLGLYFLSSIIIAISFMSIIQFLIRALDDIGKFAALIILVLQLASSGGTFPVETISKGFRWLTNLLPMTYSIRLVKESVVTSESFVFGNIVILIMFTIVTFTLTCVMDKIKKNKQTLD